MKIEFLIMMVIFTNIIKTDEVVNNTELASEENQKIVTDTVEDIQESKDTQIPSRNLREKKTKKKKKSKKAKKNKKVKSSRKKRELKIKTRKELTSKVLEDRELQRRRNPDTCDLAMELFPFFYIPIIRSTQFRIAFSSSCMRKRDYTFRVFYNDTRFINYNHHPTKVKLNIFGNKYTIDYAHPKMMDEFDIMKSLVYQGANVSGLKNAPKNININNRNDIFLNPQRKNIFNPYNIRRLSSIKGAILCTTEIRRLRGWKVLKAMREKYGDDGNGGRKLLEEHKKKVKEVLKKRKLLEKKLSDQDKFRMSMKENTRKKLWEELEKTMQDHYIKEINILCSIR